ncbi:MAG: hypothetical protein ACLFVJ_14600 [Persicimonas sp.]
MSQRTDHFERVAKAHFTPYRTKPWQDADEFPRARLDAEAFRVFRYDAQTVLDFGPRDADSLIGLADCLVDDFPYNDRTATGTEFRGPNGEIAVSLDIEAYDEWDDPDRVILAWIPDGDEGLLIMTWNTAPLDDLLGVDRDLEACGELDEMVLGFG